MKRIVVLLLLFFISGLNAIAITWEDEQLVGLGEIMYPFYGIHTKNKRVVNCTYNEDTNTQSCYLVPSDEVVEFYRKVFEKQGLLKPGENSSMLFQRLDALQKSEQEEEIKIYKEDFGMLDKEFMFNLLRRINSRRRKLL